MQTLCKPPRRVYDTKAIEACHSDLEDGIDVHDVQHGMTVAAIGAVTITNPLLGAGFAVAIWATESEEKITHTLAEWGNDIADAADAVADAFTSDSSGPGTAGSKPTTGSGYPGTNDPYADDHQNAQSGSN